HFQTILQSQPPTLVHQSNLPTLTPAHHLKTFLFHLYLTTTGIHHLHHIIFVLLWNTPHGQHLIHGQHHHLQTCLPHGSATKSHPHLHYNIHLLSPSPVTIPTTLPFHP
ncbi:hypothetical protein VIGAN_UM014800, partial [Vigna angularis var. angularis]